MTIESLTYDLGMEIIRRIFPACDRHASLSSKLQELGFRAHVPGYSFLETFCLCEADHELHRRVVADEAKRQLSAAALQLPAPDRQIKELYTSPLLKELKAQRDRENGCSELEIERNYPPKESVVRWEYDPCGRARALVMSAEHGRYQTLWKEMRNEQWRIFDSESKAHSSGMGSGREVSRDDRCEFILDAAQKYGAGLSFSHVKRKSTLRKPALCRKLNDDWEFRWLVFDTGDLVFAPFATRDNPLMYAKVPIELVLCRSSLKGDVEKYGKQGEYLALKYQWLVRDFETAYSRFFDYDGLELIIKAQFVLLGLIIEDFEGAVLSVIEDSSCCPLSG